jgi:chorismate mutase
MPTAQMKKIALLLAVMPFLPASIQAGTQEQLATCRQQIDAIDQRLVELIQERARVVQQVGAIKQEAHLPVTDTSREQLVIQKAEDLAKGGPLPAEAVGRIYQKLVEEMRNWEANLTSSEK